AGGAAATAAALGPAAQVRVANLLAPASLAALVPPGAVVVHAAPPAGDDGAPAAEEALVRAAADAGARRMIYVSSSGVYGPGAGAWIDEDVAPVPTGALGRRRLAAETAAREAAARHGVELIVLRAVAIYGPGRGAHLRIAAGTYRVVGAGAGHVCRVHVDDLGTAI